MLSKLARPIFKPSKCISLIQIRNITTPKHPLPDRRALYHGLEKTTLDVACGIKSDPRMLIDLKPMEWRTGAYKSYFEHPGVQGVSLIAILIFILAFGNMVWLNYADVTVRYGNCKRKFSLVKHSKT
jgi:hypothetical protein